MSADNNNNKKIRNKNTDRTFDVNHSVNLVKVSAVTTSDSGTFGTFMKGG